jgi:uncharacterized protein (UPF0333 family)
MGDEGALNRNEIYVNFILIAAVVLALSISTAYFFSNRKAKKTWSVIYLIMLLFVY